VYDQDQWIVLYIILVFVVFISGMFLGASFSSNRYSSREPWHARPIAAEGRPRRDGKERSANLLAVVAALIVVSGVAVLDHFKEPLFLNWPSTRSAISRANGSPDCREGANVRPDFNWNKQPVAMMGYR
jgi:hypothetical protein